LSSLVVRHNMATREVWPISDIAFSPLHRLQEAETYCALQNVRSQWLPPMPEHRIYSVSFASVYPHYVAKAEKKERTRSEVDQIIRWLTGYSQKQLERLLKKQTNFREFFNEAPSLNPARRSIAGVICGVRVQDIEDPLMQEIRYLDKLVDELAKGKAMEKILRA
jgi:hypothetical protein